ncbi:MAG TPA: hypothetical protein PKW48_11735 [Deltaproteobacteria bacterium]|jgi:tRNA U34 2-thiouridine synthase MnmA/TrmU|nr:hypothetical protein [Deltaproteobacteria bacterium]HQQ16571.1 hypothetical protein [Deltaproteobacteria bacterium]
MAKRCIALYSGGLDSILAIRMMQEQSFEVIPLYFCTPFFGYDVLVNADAHKEFHERAYGIRMHPVDFTDDIIDVVRDPRHGFGKHLNPCIDCKIRMLRKAGSMMEQLDASFVVTGEVLGQRPMSQRRDAMNLIERESGLKDLLLRPLCARHLPPTRPERTGLVDRERLGDMAGRGRKAQMELAAKYGVTPETMPTPAGGCLLADEQISRKVGLTFERFRPGVPSRADILLDILGRKFMIDEKTVLIVSRNEEENRMLSSMVFPGNIFLRIADVPGPLCVMRGDASEKNLRTAAAVCLRYSKGRGMDGRMAIYGPDPSALTGTVEASAVSEEYCRRFQIDLNK